MSTPAPIVAPGHILQALSKLLTPFRGKPRFASWCAVPIDGLQTIEDQLWALLALLDVDAADLPRLVLLGKIVGQTQRGTLENFRRFVKARILVNRSSGTGPDLIKIARILLGPLAGLADVYYTEYQPASITIEAIGAISDLDGAGVLEFLREAKMAGVGMRLVASTSTDGFLFGSVSGAADSTHGFSTEAAIDGGFLAQNW